mmetsp:Transcript_35747/g.102749  ORF Transcript_35747/g.102749 Transcript_35747/m.102749 type:complete len:260 (-) Transcript_35747:32-811(-)
MSLLPLDASDPAAGAEAAGDWYRCGEWPCACVETARDGGHAAGPSVALGNPSEARPPAAIDGPTRLVPPPSHPEGVTNRGTSPRSDLRRQRRTGRQRQRRTRRRLQEGAVTSIRKDLEDEVESSGPEHRHDQDTYMELVSSDAAPPIGNDQEVDGTNELGDTVDGRGWMDIAEDRDLTVGVGGASASRQLTPDELISREGRGPSGADPLSAAGPNSNDRPTLPPDRLGALGDMTSREGYDPDNRGPPKGLRDLDDILDA